MPCPAAGSADIPPVKGSRRRFRLLRVHSHSHAVAGLVAGKRRAHKRRCVLNAPGGLFAFVWPTARRAEAEEALGEERLVLLRRKDVVFREEEPPLVALFAASRAEDLPTEIALGEGGFPVVEPPLLVRRRDGRHAPEYAALRLSMGFPPGVLAPPRRA